MILLFAGVYFAFSQNKTSSIARTFYDKALSAENFDDSLEILKDALEKAENAADKRSLNYVLGLMYERKGNYSEAEKAYVAAAGIAAGDASSMPKVSTENLVLNAVRSALAQGDFSRADSYLNSAVRSSENSEIIAKVNLYSQWSALVKASSLDKNGNPEGEKKIKESLALLKAYLEMDSMKSVRPSVLMTLWYVTDDKEYASILEKDFPDSSENAIVQGKINLLSIPFWYFLPRSEHGESNSSLQKDTDKNEEKLASDTSSSDSEKKKTLSKNGRQQLGFFRNRENAEDLVKKLKNQGFNAYIEEVTRASGNKYHVVLVDENEDSSMGKKLKNAGFDSYPVD